MTSLTIFTLFCFSKLLCDPDQLLLSVDLKVITLCSEAEDVMSHFELSLTHCKKDFLLLNGENLHACTY